MVLDEQQNTLNSMRKILNSRTTTHWDENQVLLGHYTWVGRMKETNDKTGEAVGVHANYYFITVQ